MQIYQADLKLGTYPCLRGNLYLALLLATDHEGRLSNLRLLLVAAFVVVDVVVDVAVHHSLMLWRLQGLTHLRHREWHLQETRASERP